MQNLLKENSDYVFYIDADACFTNHNIKIESFINDKTITIGNENKNFNQPRGENSGVMLIKNN
jgi:predicted secreted protein